MTLSASDFELLLQANRILSSKLDVADVLQAVMELATKVVRAEASSLLLLDERTGELYFDVALGAAGESVKQIRLKPGEGIAGWVAKERAPIIVNDVSQDKRFTQKVDKSTSFTTRSILAVPLVAKGRLIGVVEAINKEHAQDFTSEDQEAFEVFASQAAVAIENARLFSEMMREKEKLNTVFAEMSDGIVLLDLEGKVLLLNAAGSRFFGLEPAAAFGKKFDPALFPGFHSAPSIDDITVFKAKVTPVELVREEGKDFYISALVLKLQEEGPGAFHEGYLVILRDTTEEKRGERLKRNFLSLISHKLKTPLTVIVGYAPALMSKTDNFSDFQKKAITAIYNQGEQLSGLVDKLLRFAILESDALKKKIEPRALSPIVNEAVEAMPAHSTDGVAIVLDPSLSTAPDVKVDGSLLVEVFKNLIENGIKFNDKPAKRIEIGAQAKDKFVTVSLIDNGVGIPPEERDKIFQKFYQIENSFTGQVPGAGLGLALCKKVIEEMGGEIHLQSDLGKGTTVTLSLPKGKSKGKH